MEALKQVSAYQTQPKTQVRPATKQHKPVWRARWNRRDRVYMGMALGTTVVAAFCMIMLSNNATQAQVELNRTSAELAQVQKQNNDLKQEAGDLSNPARLDAIAKKNGLSMNNNNVRNVK